MFKYGIKAEVLCAYMVRPFNDDDDDDDDDVGGDDDN